MHISNSIIFSISKPPDEWIYILRKRISNILHNIGLNIFCFFQQLFLQSLEEFLWLHEQRAWSFDVLLNISFGKVIEGKGSHSHPDDLISVLIEPVDKLMVSIMEVILVSVIIDESPNVIFCQGPIDVTNEQFVKVCVEVNLGIEGQISNSKFQLVPAKIQMHIFELLGSQFGGVHVAILIEVKCDIGDEGLIHNQFDGLALSQNRQGTEACKKLGRSINTCFMPNHNDISDTLHQSLLVQGRTKYS